MGNIGIQKGHGESGKALDSVGDENGTV